MHTYVQATSQRDPEVYGTQHDPKIYPHTKFRIPTLNYIKHKERQNQIMKFSASGKVHFV